MYNKIKSVTSDVKLQKIIFCRFYFSSNINQKFTANEYNYASIELNQFWGGGDGFFQKKYYCGSDGATYSVFNSELDLIQFLSNRWQNRIGPVQDTPEDITKFIVNNYYANTTNNYNTVIIDIKNEYINKIKEGINIFNGVKTP